MSPTERSRTMEALFTVWFPHVRDLLCAAAGLYFLWHEVVIETKAETAVLGLGIVLLAISGSGIAQRILDKAPPPDDD